MGLKVWIYKLCDSDEGSDEMRLTCQTVGEPESHREPVQKLSFSSVWKEQIYTSFNAEYDIENRA